MHELFASLPERLAGTLAEDWARSAVRSSSVDVSAWEELFLQVGFPLGDELRGVLTRSGAFELLAFGDPEDREDPGDELQPDAFLRDLSGPGCGRSAGLDLSTCSRRRRSWRAAVRATSLRPAGSGSSPSSGRPGRSEATRGPDSPTKRRGSATRPSS